MSRILITGASGFLGKKLHTHLKKRHVVIGTYQMTRNDDLVHLDITSPAEVDSLFKAHRPDIVIHTASLSSPDACEKQRELAERTNHGGTRHIVDACRKTGAKLIYISTSHVFDGTKQTYRENDPPQPVNYYGETKLRAEQAMQSLDNSVILRFDLLYGYNNKNDARGFFAAVARGEIVQADDRRIKQPLFADDVCDAIDIILQHDYRGVFHLGGPERITAYSLCIALQTAVRSDKSCIHRAEGTPPQGTRRPERISLDTTKAQRAGMLFHSLPEAIHIIRNQWEQS